MRSNDHQEGFAEYSAQKLDINAQISPLSMTTSEPHGPEKRTQINLGRCSYKRNGVSALTIGASDPPTQAEVQAIASKLDELINTLRR